MAKDRFKARSQRDRMRQYGHEPAKAGPGPVPYDAAAFLRTARYRVKHHEDPEVEKNAAEVAGYALERGLQVCAGQVDEKVGQAVLKASAQLREEICEPIVKKTELAGSLSLEQLVERAAEAEKPALQKLEEARARAGKEEGEE
jgi:hypothetical protein